MKKAQEMSIEILVVMALALLLVSIWYLGQGKVDAAVRENIDEGKCIAAVNTASIVASGHGEHKPREISDAVGFKIEKGNLSYQDLCCVEIKLKDDKPHTGNKKEILGLLSRKINTTCALGIRLGDEGYDTSDFCFIGLLKVKATDSNILPGDVEKLTLTRCKVSALLSEMEKNREVGLTFHFKDGVVEVNDAS